jgi:hypothetical protein
MQDLELIDAKFPHIGRPLRLLWGAPEVATYIDRLLMDTRGGTRRGFPKDVLDALMRIRGEHASLSSNHDQRPTRDKWAAGGYR